MPRPSAAPAGPPPETVHETALGRLLCGDSLPWLGSLPSASVQLVVADPPYGIGKAPWDEFGSRETWLHWTASWLGELARALTSDGSAYVMGFPERLALVQWAAGDAFASCRWLVWAFRNRGNMARDWGRSHESILHLRKSRDFFFDLDAARVPYNAHTQRYPLRAQGASSQFGRSARAAAHPAAAAWEPHPLGARPRDVLEVPLLNNGMAERTPHPTQKPEELLRRLVAACSRPGDLVVDPFSGSGSTAVVCEMLGRRWLACERDPGYCGWAKERLLAVQRGEHGIGALDRATERMQANRLKVREKTRRTSPSPGAAVPAPAEAGTRFATADRGSGEGVGPD
jgi:site-specific DNA-methyltransferase (adenine-specific)